MRKMQTRKQRRITASLTIMMATFLIQSSAIGAEDQTQATEEATEAEHDVSEGQSESEGKVIDELIEIDIPGEEGLPDPGKDGAASNEADAKFGAAGATRRAAQYWLPFSCKETWEAHTNLSNQRPPLAIDFNLPNREDNGRPVYAAAPGTVSHVGHYKGKRGLGKHVEISHGEGRLTVYGHLLNENKERVKVGQKVSEKTIIGLIGSTGNSTGPHLHFVQQVNGKPVPARFRDGSPPYARKHQDTLLKRKTNCP